VIDAVMLYQNHLIKKVIKIGGEKCKKHEQQQNEERKRKKFFNF